MKTLIDPDTNEITIKTSTDELSQIEFLSGTTKNGLAYIAYCGSCGHEFLTNSNLTLNNLMAHVALHLGSECEQMCRERNERAFEAIRRMTVGYL